jgi:mono/diheme cytochrome c family protein
MKMQFAVFTIVGAAVLALGYAPIRASQADKKTTWDSVYTQDQATKGETLYNDKCARCHGVNGAGADAPALVGSDFAADWDGLSVDQLFDRTRNTMPQDDPQSLSRDQTAQVLAFMFQKNGFPAGEMELPGASDALHSIMYVATKK